MVTQRIAGGWPQLQLPSSDQAEFVICDHTIDITWIHLRHEDVYLAVIMDVFPRQIRGWYLSRSLDHSLTCSALFRAMQQYTPEIHHSDQGGQYAALDYTDTLRARGVQISMADVGAAWQNRRFPK